MAIPSYMFFIEPLLRVLAQYPEGVRAGLAHEQVANILGLTPEEREQLLASGNQAIHKNRSGWAHDRLKRKGYSTSTRRGVWQITSEGRDFVRQHPSPFTNELVRELAVVDRTERLRPLSDQTVEGVSESFPDANIVSTPDERLQSALNEIRETVAADLLETLAEVSPSFFERIVLEVLHRMGYGATRDDLRKVGGSGDGGIDGIISLDRLGLEKVYVQAKRWQHPVGRPEVQAFYGALAGLRARKGVFITTSNFTNQALEFARNVEGFVLVDGNQLAQLMIDHAVGVSLRAVHIPRLDSDYFEGE